MPRLFTGLELPEVVVGQLALLRGGVVGARWLEPEDYHITLRFIGDIDARVARDIDEILSDIRRPEAPIRFEELSWFGGDKPRAIVARVKGDPALMDLQAEQERRLRRIGVEPETRKYTPHVTLARLRGGGRRRSLAISPRAASWSRTRSSRSASSSIPPARARAADPMSLRRPIRWAKDRHRLSRLRLAGTSRYRDASHFHGLEAL
jgi:RNA 2',3'-cyclic 3'-phosphodiesterase